MTVDCHINNTFVACESDVFVGLYYYRSIYYIVLEIFNIVPISTIGITTHDNYYCTRFKSNGSNLFFAKPNQIIILYNTSNYYERFVMHTRTIATDRLRT